MTPYLRSGFSYQLALHLKNSADSPGIVHDECAWILEYAMRFLVVARVVAAAYGNYQDWFCCGILGLAKLWREICAGSALERNRLGAKMLAYDIGRGCLRGAERLFNKFIHAETTPSSPVIQYAVIYHLSSRGRLSFDQRRDTALSHTTAHN
jgi:hypothetical protein